MKAEKNYEFRTRMCEVHRPDIGSVEAARGREGLVIDGSFPIALQPGAGEVARHAAADLADYLRVSHGVRVAVTEKAPSPAIALCVVSADAPDAPKGRQERAYRIAVSEAGVRITANTERGLFAATVYLEELMNEAEAPLLAYAVTDRRPVFSPRMTHSGYELDVFPEEYMNRLAHDGYDTLLIFVKGAGEAAHGGQDFNTTIATAARYGLDVYAYSYIVSEKNPHDEGAEEYYESTYGRLFRESPGFRGVVFVGESCEFPSRDPRVYPWLLRDHPKGVPHEKPFSRNFPAADYPEWLEFVKGIIHRYVPDADVLFWTYNWPRAPKEARISLVENLPKDVSLHTTYEAFAPLPTPEGLRVYATDYTIAVPGPGQAFLDEAEAAKRAGLRLYTMSNTAGMTWDIGTVPYMPTPYIFAERYEGLLDAHEKYGLCGLMESHHYGAYHSFISELSKEMGWSPRRPFDEQLEAIAAREFGKENVATVLKAWQHASEGMRHNMSTIENQYGPLRVGPSYPLVMRTIWEFPSPDFSHFGGNRITFPKYGAPYAWSKTHCAEDPKRLLLEIGEFGKMQAEYDEAAALFRSVTESLSGRRREEAGRMTAHLWFIARTAETTKNAIRFAMLRRSVDELSGHEPHSIMDKPEWSTSLPAHFGLDRMTPEGILKAATALAERECENARSTIPAVEYDSRLGYEPSMEYMCDKEHLLWKIDCTRKALCELRELIATL